MKYFKSFSESLERIGEGDFEEMAIQLFRLQAAANPVYRAYVEARRLSIHKVSKLEEIPFLPLSFFKSKQVYCGEIADPNQFYSSSGTTDQINSKHYFWSEEYYLSHAKRIFEQFYGSLTDYHLIALLPSYLERQGSSLVRMADFFIQETKSNYSGFYLYNHQELVDKLGILSQLADRKVLLLGVTFALLDLADSGLDFPRIPGLTVMETGGMKGRRREMIRDEVHDRLKVAFGVGSIHSEYGMTEMMSQLYSKGGGKYELPPSVRVLIRDPHDPFAYGHNKTGGINVIDLANFHSCAFLETQDLGRWDEEGRLEILGRFDHSDLRGCNLMVN
ncbi:MAG: acyl transferase [Lunatimonas sp.]|uniref:acyl transferase n=1 Tax=Lunatimonas sp. TaxID=2060141 RepID=UPI00263AF71C|nr:acyl transferase [Lunatimonas sp.]MCC5939398.1 acyl transferase [Lunatimonas sp.]